MKYLVFSLGLAVGACSLFGPAERDEIESTAAKLAHCQEMGREAGSYAAYDACKKDAGL